MDPLLLRTHISTFTSMAWWVKALQAELMGEGSNLASIFMLLSLKSNALALAARRGIWPHISHFFFEEPRDMAPHFPFFFEEMIYHVGCPHNFFGEISRHMPRGSHV